MEALESNVASQIRLELFTLADKRYTLCDISNGGGPKFDGL